MAHGVAGSKFDLTFVDLSQMWGTDNTYLNVVSSGSYELRGYSDEFVIELMLEELRNYIPFRDSWISGKPFLQQHLDQPIYLADVGSWRDRPKAPTNIPNVFLCGSYCRSEIDTITVEGAINTGLQAAEALRQACGSESPPIENLLPEKASSMEMLWWKMWLAPYAVGAKMWSDYLNLIKG